MARARLAAAGAAALMLPLLLAVAAGAICDTNQLPTLKPVRLSLWRPGRKEELRSIF